MSSSHIPNLNIVVRICAVAILGYFLFSVYAVMILKDATMTGDIIGTWKSFAVLAFGFWIGSSSGGKEKKDSPAGTDEDPTKTKIINEPNDPANVQEQPKET